MKSNAPVTFDFDLNSNQLLTDEGIKFAVGKKAVEIGIKQRLNLFQGEFFADLEAGTPWYQKILGQKNAEAKARAALRAVILRTPGVVAVDALRVNFDGKTRTFSISYKVKTEFDDIVQNSLDFKSPTIVSPENPNPPITPPTEPVPLLDLDFRDGTQPIALDTYTRASSIEIEAGEDVDGVMLESRSTNVYAEEYHPNFTHPSKLGMRSIPRHINVCQNSNSFLNTPWVRSGITFNGNLSPGLIRAGTSPSFVMTAGATLQQDFTTVATERYNQGIYIRPLQSSTVTVELYDVTGASSISNTVYNLTANQWIKIFNSGLAASTSSRMLFTFTTPGNYQLARGYFGAEPINGSNGGYYSPSSTTTSPVATERQFSIVSNVISNAYINHAEGEIFIDYIPLDGNHLVNSITVGFNPPSGNNDRKWVRNNSAGIAIYSAAGASVGSVSNPAGETADNLISLRLAWDETSTIDGTKNLRLAINGAEVDFDTGAFVSGLQEGDLIVGNYTDSAGAAANHQNAIISRIRVFDTVQDLA